jgi:lysophospholipase L1-like esterase
MRRRAALAVVALLVAGCGRSEERPLLVGFGDSITGGYGVPNNQSYIDMVADIRGWTAQKVASGGAAASCWGRDALPAVVRARPDVVIMAFGTNDMQGSPLGCNPSIEEFRRAVRSILLQLRNDLPRTSVYVMAILPRREVALARLERWNRVLAEESSRVGVRFVDPFYEVPPTGFFDGTHPGLGTHRLLAQYWARILPTEPGAPLTD